MSGPLQVIVDGRVCTDSWTQDRALNYGDGLFETMRVRDGCIRFESLHRERLARGCERLQIRADHPAIWQQAQQLAAQQRDVMLKLLLTRGDALERGYAPTGGERARLILSVHPPSVAADLPADRQVVALRSCLGENPDLAGIKHCNRLEQVLARASLRGSGAFEGLLGSSSGLLISGTMSNVFLELDGELVTPALERCGIAGVMRAVVLREALQARTPVRVADVPMTALARCTALAVSSVRLGLLDIHQLDGRRLRVSAALQSLAARIDALER